MTTLHQPNVADKFTTTFIKKAARRLKQQLAFRHEDFTDIVQDLTLSLIEQQENFDPDRGTWSTFVKTVIGKAAVDLGRKHRAYSRQFNDECPSLNVSVHEDDRDDQQVDFANTITEDEARNRLALQSRTQHEQVDLALDVQAVLRKMPKDLRRIAQALQRDSVADVAKNLGISRTTMNRRVEEIREYLVSAGLDHPA